MISLKDFKKLQPIMTLYEMRYDFTIYWYGPPPPKKKNNRWITENHTPLHFAMRYELSNSKKNSKHVQV